MSNALPDRTIPSALVAALRSRVPFVAIFSAAVGAVTFIGLGVVSSGHAAKAVPLAAMASACMFVLGLAISAGVALFNRSRAAAPGPKHQPAAGAGGPCPTLSTRPHAPPGDDETEETMRSTRTTSESMSGQPAAVTPADQTRVATIGSLARRISTHSNGGGYRTLVAGETDLMGISGHGIELAKAIADIGQSVILIDWAPEGDGVGHALELSAGPGIAELLAGKATFEQIIRRMPGSDAHVIGAGTFEESDAGSPDADRLNLILDALDEAYDQVIVAGRTEPARIFFETIEGRVDCGVLIADPARSGAGHQDPPGTYLGYEVADIDLIRYDRQLASTAGQRLVRSGRNTAAAAAV
jgi:Mrp family chromosome partitioning ATPase